MLAENLKSPDISNQDFAQQVRSERLDIIWKVTLVVVVAVMWFTVLFSSEIARDLAPSGVLMIISCLVCRFYLGRIKLEAAIWAYAIGMLLSVGLVMTVDNNDIRQLAPFTVLVIFYIAGLMLSTRSLVPLFLLTLAVIIVSPWIGDGKITSLTDGVVLAIVLVIFAALVTAQASGELYGIAEWALESYRRERASAATLFESRQQVERSLRRQQALTTELQTTNDDLAEARRAAEEAKHFRGQFLANMSHELRTPLNAIIGFSETMLNFPPMYNNIELPEEYRADLSQINSSGKHLLNIINDILDLSKIDVGRLDVDMQSVELEPIFKGVLSTAVGLVGGKPIKLLRDLPSDIPDVMGDPVRIRQVLLNLYSNAAKFTESGSITLRMSSTPTEVTIAVVDTGEGIPPDNMEIIFEEFRQAAAGRKKARAGAGLGLAISRQLLTLMGGRIWVESQPGKGSSFFCVLPRHTEVPTTKLETDLVSQGS